MFKHTEVAVKEEIKPKQQINFCHSIKILTLI